MIHVNQYGFPRRNKAGEMINKTAQVQLNKNLQTGDIAKAIVLSGKNAGIQRYSFQYTNKKCLKSMVANSLVPDFSYRLYQLRHTKDADLCQMKN